MAPGSAHNPTVGLARHPLHSTPPMRSPAQLEEMARAYARLREAGDEGAPRALAACMLLVGEAARGGNAWRPKVDLGFPPRGPSRIFYLPPRGG